ncbi:hypothetical protein [Methylopila sp. Yamaguchi]|uniref:hypothetical protein n=1 Tax=Methylopila sp. Yamaguchi TaxID=1437817 RepID=UPI000CB043CA|nr:hypothetical protein [Methylopila sp. Yamaguchi]GBD48151.1 hypothetical protein METY_1364 [Methylopila sp. Yamaguchi]
MSNAAEMQRDRSPADDPVTRQGLFPCDAEIARRLSLGSEKFRLMAAALEPLGFPRRDELVGRRYWPAVRAFLDRRYGVGSLASPSHVDGEENLDAF